MPIYPQIRLTTAAAEDAPAFFHRPWIDDHIICFVESDNQGWRYLKEPEVDALGGFDALLKQAADNLDQLMQQPNSVQAGADPQGQPQFIVAQGNPYLSGLLLDDGFLGFLRSHLGNRFRICIPSADELIAFRTPHDGDYEATALTSFRTAEHPVSPHVYEFDGETIQVCETREHEADRLVIRELTVRVAAPNSTVMKRTDKALLNEQRVDPLTKEHADELDACRTAGATLIGGYGTSPEGRINPTVLDATLRAWQTDTRKDRPPEEAVAGGLGVFLGDLYCAVMSGEWVTYTDPEGTDVAVRTERGSLLHPIQSIFKRLDAPAGSIEELINLMLEAELRAEAGAPTQGEFFTREPSNPLSSNANEMLTQFREFGYALLTLYQTAPDGQMSPPVLDATFSAWQEDKSGRVNEAVLICGLSALFGDLVCHVGSAEWAEIEREGKPMPVLKAASGRVGHPHQAITDMILHPDSSPTLQQLLDSILESEANLTQD